MVLQQEGGAEVAAKGGGLEGKDGAETITVIGEGGQAPQPVCHPLKVTVFPGVGAYPHCIGKEGLGCLSCPQEAELGHLQPRHSKTAEQGLLTPLEQGGVETQ